MRASAKSFRRLASVSAVTVLLSGRAFAFDYISDASGFFPLAWNPGAVPIQLKMPAPATPLIDGTNYNTSTQIAIDEWNAQLGTVQFATTFPAPGGNTNGNGINEIVMTSTINGSAFAANTLAVALTLRTGSLRTEGDIIFNPAFTWDSYRGARSQFPGRFDIRRVALHELGHVLGLDHPDQGTPPQNRVAIMNSRSSDTDSLQSDDIAGGQSLYGAPGVRPANDSFANATIIDPATPAAQLVGTNVAATKESGEPNHAGNGGGRSVWWRWTAPAAGSVTITTLGSLFDTVLGVYTGTSVSALTTVGSNDDVQSGVIRTSTVTFSATAGATYRIAVDGFDGDAAPAILNFSFNAGGGVLPSITSHPASILAAPGGNVNFNVGVTGNPTGYQWFFNGNAIAGATGATLGLGTVSSANAGDYRVVITNAAGSTSSGTFSLTVFTDALPAQNVSVGRSVSFSTASSNNTVQWQVSSNGGGSFSNLANNTTYSGVTTSVLTVANVSTTLHDSRYRYILTGPGNGGNSTSNASALRVAALTFPSPTGVAADSAGNLYVTDSSTATVQVVAPNGTVTLLAGASGQTGSTDGTGSAARFNSPAGIVALADGSFAVVESANSTIRRVTASGVVTTLAGSPTTRGSTDGPGSTATFSTPFGIARDSSGNLFVADSSNHTIRRITPAGNVSTLAGTPGSAGTSDGTGSAARFNQPLGIAVDSAGNVFVADTGNSLIRKITPAGVVTTAAGVVGISGAQSGAADRSLFNQPQGVAVDAAGNVYIADTGNHSIRLLSPSANVATLAGLSRVAGNKDGFGGDGWFSQPRSLTIDANGNLIVVDTGNAALRRVTPAGFVTTVALPLASAGTPTPPPVIAPPASPPPSGGGGGGGGAPSWWFAAALSALALARTLCRREPK